jgi:fluoroacetyl-CoA thioesterase
MDSSALKPSLFYEFKFKISENKTVPFLYPKSSEFQVMPKVFATGFMVGLFEWTCIQAINPYLDWPSEQTVGTDVKLSHSAANCYCKNKGGKNRRKKAHLFNHS